MLRSYPELPMSIVYLICILSRAFTLQPPALECAAVLVRYLSDL